tara:strand:- start:195 stop:425 length:231 start_codon:yes stop_codon:yes gene_type:complete
MNEVVILNFTVGFLLGGIMGVIGMAILGSRRQTDMFQEIMDLRTQRKLLKEELLKRVSRKPPPRKRRKNIKQTGKN